MTNWKIPQIWNVRIDTTVLQGDQIFYLRSLNSHDKDPYHIETIGLKKRKLALTAKTMF